MKTNKRLERYFYFLEDIKQAKQFIPSELISLHKVSKNVKYALIGLKWIKKVPNHSLYNYIGKKPTKQMAQMLIDKVNLYYKQNKFISDINKHNEQKGGVLVKLTQTSNNSSVKIINETKEQPFLLWYRWVSYRYKEWFWSKNDTINYAVSNALVYANDYNNACDKLRFKHKDVEITKIIDLTIR